MAGVIALAAEPLPPLERIFESEGWTRGIELIGLIAIFWTLLSAIGVIRTKIAISQTGVSVERLLQTTEQKHAAVVEGEQELRQISQRLRELHDLVSATFGHQLTDYRLRIEALESQVREHLSAGEDRPSPEAPDA